MKGMKERLVKKIKLITTVKTLKQGLALHKSNVDRTIHHLRDETVTESGCVTPKLLELEDAEEQKLKEDEEREILLEFEEICPPRGEDSVVFYTTSSPRLFIRGRYIGGAEEVVALNENGKLRKLLEGISKVNSPCECCENERFLICSSCNGSSKLPADGEEIGNNKIWIRCRECNENGLVKCSLCT